jgi:hypothetical protein
VDAASRSSASRSAGRVERGELRLPFGSSGGEVGGRATIAPREAIPRRHALVDCLQPLGLDLGVMQVARQAVRSVLQLSLRALQHVDDGGQLRVECGHVLQRVDGAAGERLGVLVGIAHRGQRAARRIDQRLRVGELLVLGIELVPFAGAGPSLSTSADLPRQALALAREVGLLRACALQRVAAAFQRDHAAASGAVSTPAYASSSARTDGAA